MPVTANRTDHGITVDGGLRLRLDDAANTVELGGVGALAATVLLHGRPLDVDRSELALATSSLGRVVQHAHRDPVTARLTWDVHETGNLHLYVRITTSEPVDLAALTLLHVAAPAGRDGTATLEDDEHGAWGTLELAGGQVAVTVTKPPWLAHWNDVGAHGHRTIATARLHTDAGTLQLAAGQTGQLTPGQTLEAAFLLRPLDGSPAARAAARAEATYAHPDEIRYVPEGEFRHQRIWELEDIWLGPPITDGAPQRPYDQLIPRPLGLNVLARKRFTWSNEDFSLWRLTGKEHYRESGVKKAHALLATQNEHGGWYEGVEFYNLPPRHHHMYDTYIAGMFLLDAWDATGDDAFLAGAGRAVDFWHGPPPANGHVEVAPGAWWYRWGGYVNEFGYTDERCVLNTHAGATAFLALYAERTGDERAARAACAGIEAMRWGLDRGIQRGDGQFLYCLSQIDPTLVRPGDPPYIQADLVPQIEDVYTVASSYRLMLALRSIDAPDVRAAIRRALDYWWTGYRAGRVYTYRAYATIAFGVAAGEIDLRYALALPEILRDPQHFTSMQRGLSAFVAPHGLPLLDARVDGVTGRFVEPVFLRRRPGELLLALVNLEQPLAHVPVRIGLPDGVRVRAVSQLDPAAAEPQPEPLPWSDDERAALIDVTDLQEFAVTVLRLELEEPGA